jgi:hypothetical protein
LRTDALLNLLGEEFSPVDQVLVIDNPDPLAINIELELDPVRTLVVAKQRIEPLENLYVLPIVA